MRGVFEGRRSTLLEVTISHICNNKCDMKVTNTEPITVAKLFICLPTLPSSSTSCLPTILPSLKMHSTVPRSHLRGLHSTPFALSFVIGCIAVASQLPSVCTETNGSGRRATQRVHTALVAAERAPRRSSCHQPRQTPPKQDQESLGAELGAA